MRKCHFPATLYHLAIAFVRYHSHRSIASDRPGITFNDVTISAYVTDFEENAVQLGKRQLSTLRRDTSTMIPESHVTRQVSQASPSPGVKDKHCFNCQHCRRASPRACREVSIGLTNIFAFVGTSGPTGNVQTGLTLCLQNGYWFGGHL